MFFSQKGLFCAKEGKLSICRKKQADNENFKYICKNNFHYKENISLTTRE